MNGTRFQVRSVVGSAILAGGLILGGCARMPSPTTMEMQLAPEAAGDMSRGAEAPTGGSMEMAVEPAMDVPQAQPMLIKTAALTVTVDSPETALDQATAIARQKGGDLLNLSDQVPQGRASRHTATLRLRVPQQHLESTLDALADLGTVKQRSITAEDVSTQLVDLEARLRNLRKTEELLLKIMDRSGNMADVLKVAQELSQVRSSIEQLDAQQRSLQTRVAFSEITLSLESAIATTPPDQALSPQLEETWNNATYSIRAFTINLMQLGIWLLVYSPYLIVFGAIAGVIIMRQRRSPATPSETPPTQS